MGARCSAGPYVLTMIHFESLSSPMRSDDAVFASIQKLHDVFLRSILVSCHISLDGFDQPCSVHWQMCGCNLFKARFPFYLVDVLISSHCGPIFRLSSLWILERPMIDHGGHIYQHASVDVPQTTWTVLHTPAVIDFASG